MNPYAEMCQRHCFVIMPFGIEEIDGFEVDFDDVFEKIFKRAIRNVKLLEGGSLRPRRADKVQRSGFAQREMYLAVLLSRIALGEVSSPSTNVGIEIGARLAHTRSGTVLAHLEGTAIPFNLQMLRVIGYSHRPEEARGAARRAIAATLRHTLREEPADSPIFEARQQIALALGTPEEPTELAELLIGAEEAARAEKPEAAIESYRLAQELLPRNALFHQRRAVLLRDNGDLEAAVREFRRAGEVAPRYADAYRELGLTERALAERSPDAARDRGVEALERALKLDPKDRLARESLSVLRKETAAGAREEQLEQRFEIDKILKQIERGPKTRVEPKRRGFDRDLPSGGRFGGGKGGFGGGKGGFGGGGGGGFGGGGPGGGL